MKQVGKIIFDKTGTLTQGTQEISYINSFIKEKDLLEVAASLEHLDDLYLAKILIEKAGLHRYKKVLEFKKIPGKGIEGEIDKKDILVGNIKLMTERSIALQSLGSRIKEYEESGKQTLIVAINDKIAGVIVVSDRLKDDAINAITRLQRLKYETYILTADSEKSSRALSKKLNNSGIIFDSSQENILNKIKEFQSLEGVAFVGSPGKNTKAINNCNVGIVMGKEGDFGQGTEDILITKSSVTSIVEIFKLSKEVQTKIQQNLIWALGYNIVAIPFAALGLLHPIMAEVAMIASTLSIYLNSNLLRTKRIS